MNIESVILYINERYDYIEIKLNEKNIREKAFDDLNKNSFTYLNPEYDIIINDKVVIKKKNEDTNLLKLTLPVHNPMKDLDDVLAIKIKDKEEFLKFGDFLAIVQCSFDGEIQDTGLHDCKIYNINEKLQIQSIPQLDRLYQIRYVPYILIIK